MLKPLWMVILAMTSFNSLGNEHCHDRLLDDNKSKFKNEESNKELEELNGVRHKSKECQPNSISLSPDQVKYMDTIGPAIAEILRLCEQKSKTDNRILESNNEILYCLRKVLGTV